MSPFVGKQHPSEQFEHKISNLSFHQFSKPFIYHNLNQHSSINILGVPSKSLILKELPIEVARLIDLGGLTSVYIKFEVLGLSFSFIFDHFKRL